MKKHEEFKGFITDLREKNINFYETGAPFFIGYLNSKIQHIEENGQSTIPIADVLKAMKEAYDHSLGIY
ncbi:hypothetical protein RCG19_15905 [Neobacillus sp. OS1-2]|uniref:hypothetical protein n=1 Tax=Neobacillus sp. OS1-2 TaxID=3070680 RepID=UPI0027E17ABD|nr:hypothetical protein [Neobacillus sp. OS1-2]WML38672.1 hypothetical protein RCG19_15905 [Neobacillus sp. OS1-2]